MGLRTLPHVVIAGVLAAGATPALAQDCSALPEFKALQQALKEAVQDTRDVDQVGLGNEMWATTVDRDGIVCAVVFSGGDRDDQWPGSRVISAQKANAGNAFSLEEGDGAGIPLSSGNLYGLVQPGGSLFALPHSNPVDTAVAYGGPDHADGDASDYGRPNDPMIGQFIGGVNVFGGGLALYDESGKLLGGLGASGDTSCTDHIIAWKVRAALNLDNIPGGVADGTDNLIIVDPPEPNTFQHPPCGFGEEPVVAALPDDFPVGAD